VSAGASAANYGLAETAKARGYRKINVVITAIPTAAVFAESFKDAAQANGIELGNDIIVPPTLTDMSAPVAQAEGADAVYVLLPPTQVLSYLQALKQAGSTTPVLVQSGLLQASYIADTGGASSPAEGALVGDNFPAATDPGWDDFKAAVEAYDGNTSDIDFDNSLLREAWITMDVFVQAVSSIDGEINKESVLAALNSADAVSLHGLGPDLDFTTPFTSPDAPRLFNRTVFTATVENGQFAAEGGPIDVTRYFVAG
jgi:ABC-type branched-subunit amino acid transport system substrate-binding protein